MSSNLDLKQQPLRRRKLRKRSKFESSSQPSQQPRRNGTLQRMTNVSFFLCLLARASSNSSEVEDHRVCIEPRLLKLKQRYPQFSPRAILPPSSVHYPDDDTLQNCMVKAQLGDSIRSDEASDTFFHSLDSDHDGILEPEEVASFLKDQIGGSQFDTQSAVDKEVSTVMKRLDQNHDGIEMSDVLDYWMQLESLLTAEEVSEWVVYAVQLPKTVGKSVPLLCWENLDCHVFILSLTYCYLPFHTLHRIFLENGITGYDFPEIVENGGEVLLNELGIDKTSFRNKIVRQMQARMLGIGSIPDKPTQFYYKLDNCKAVSFTWERSSARVFPVHSYRIQRRAINLFENGSTNENNMPIANDFSMVTYPPVSTSDWKTVYVGGENEFVDSSLETGHNYIYRIQAWNSVGRSGWEVVDLTKPLRKQRCSTKPSRKEVHVITPRQGINIEEESPWAEWLSIPSRVVWGFIFVIQSAYHLVRVFFMVIAMGAGIMRFRRASASSSASATPVLPFTWFWMKLNNISVKLIGSECIPRTMLGDREALQLQEKLHDERIMATGLRGYNRLKQASSDVRNEEKELGESKVTFASDSSKVDRRRALGKQKSYSTGNLHSATAATTPVSPLKEVVISRGGITSSKFTWKTRASKSNTSSDNISEESGPSSDNETSALSPKTGNSIASASISGTPNRGTIIDDGSTCIVCQKKFKFGKRYKHHCSRCMATFCHKHGRTSHNNFTSCKVPGSCLCNPCLELHCSRGTSPTRQVSYPY